MSPRSVFTARPGRYGTRMPPLPFPRDRLPTPALVIDRAAFEANVAAMAAFARERGIALRPHAKTHKSRDIALRQIAAGAVGICCAKLAEAEALAGDGVDSIHLTSPVVAGEALDRLEALIARTPGVSLVADHPATLDRLAAIGRRAGAPLDVFVDVDPGMRRTGVAIAEDALALAWAIAAADGLRFAGVQFYCGSDQHIIDRADRRASLTKRAAFLRAVLAPLERSGLPAPVVTGGGTGSFAIDAELGVLTELQVGSYIFMDREYLDCDLAGAPRFAPALAVDATVISANAPGRVTIDAGLKALASDAGPPRLLHGADPSLAYAFTGDEHGALIGADESLPGLGARVSLIPGHCDPTVNLYDRYHVCDGEIVVAIWPVTARGCSS